MKKKNKRSMKKFYPASPSEVDLKASNVKLHGQMSKFSKDVGDKTKIRDERVVVRDTKTGKVYGVRTMAGKSTAGAGGVTEGTELNLIRLFVSEADQGLTQKDVETAIPMDAIAEIKSNIRKGAKDLTQDWSNALELCQKAYQVAGILRPGPDQKASWAQYEECIQYAVQQLARTRGLDGKWRMTSLGLKAV